MTATVGLTAIMKDEHRAILEWVAYHRLIGFDPIVIYSNDCSDGSPALLDALAHCGAIQHRRQQTHAQGPPQHAAYRDSVAKAACEWMAFLDADEFFVCKRDASVRDFVARFDADVSAIAVNWRLFGSSGEKSWRPGLVVERFTRAAFPDHPGNRHFKSIARVRDIDYMAVHLARLRRGRYVDATGRTIDVGSLGETERAEIETAQINHYCVKSLEEFEGKRRRGRADRASGAQDKYSSRDDPSFFELHDRNEQEDLALFSRADEIRREIARLAEALRGVGVLVFG